MSKSNNKIDSFHHELLTEDELCEYLRISQVQNGQKRQNIIANLKRMRGLPCVHICRQPLYFLPSIRAWLQKQIEEGK